MHPEGGGEPAWTARQYRAIKNKVLVTAIQFTSTPQNVAAIVRWLGGEIPAATRSAHAAAHPELLFHDSHKEEGIRSSDWIVRLPNGSLIVMTSQTFNAEYYPTDAHSG